jgi:quercetin dioxygenase-like cupin family protein
MSEVVTQISNALSSPVKTAAQMRASILRLEAAMLATPGHLLAPDFKTTHHFTPGIYMRELFIPKGTTLIGKIHKHEHLNILSQGDITVWTDDGMKRLTASTVIKSQPGIKRVGHAHEDSVWITVHLNPTDERDVDLIEEMLTAKTFEEVLGFTGTSPKELEK